MVYTRIRLLLLIRPFIFYCFFLQYSSIKIFITLFSETVRPRKLKLGAHVDNGWMSCIPESGGCCIFVPSFFHFSFSSIFKY